jgi:hypothetical protein
MAPAASLSHDAHALAVKVPWEAEMVTRSFLVVAACLLVTAFALAVLPAWDMSLREALAAIDADVPARLQSAVTGALGAKFWRWAAEPLLVRPSWLVPAALGLICLGCAATAYTPPGRHTKRRSFPK